jgi:hypothetical protein
MSSESDESESPVRMNNNNNKVGTDPKAVKALVVAAMGKCNCY